MSLTPGGAISRPYAPSPRPTFDRPTAIAYSTVTRHIWGDQEAGEVTDWIYASTSWIHGLVFGMAPGGRFGHSPSFRTVFGADEVFHVLSGTMVIANPETGEVHKVPAGGRVCFGPDTWHHAFAHGTEPLRVLELFAPPPSTGTSGAYAKDRPYLEQPHYARAQTDHTERGDNGGSIAPRQTLRVVRDDDITWRRDLGVLIGMVSESDHLAVATLEIGPGECSVPHAHGGDELVYSTGNGLWIRAWQNDVAYVFELQAGDACYLPAGVQHEYRNPGGGLIEAVIGVAPRFDP